MTRAAQRLSTIWVALLVVLNNVEIRTYLINHPSFHLLVPGLTYKKLNRLEDSLDCFLKHHAILRNSTEVMYQLASLYPSSKLLLWENMLCAFSAVLSQGHLQPLTHWLHI